MLCYRCGSFTPDDSRKCAVCGQPISVRRRTLQPTAQSEVGGLIAPPINPGEVLAGRYRVIDTLALGATGWVLRARDLEADAELAIKVITKNILQTDVERARFLNTVKESRRRHHPNLVRIFDEGQNESQVYYTMPRLEGLALRKIIDLRLEGGRVFSHTETLPLMAQLALAVDSLASLGGHGALRPNNIIVLPDVLKVTGYVHHRGIPRLPAALTQLKQLDYLAPEARSDSVMLSSNADIYSLAVIFVEMTTGVVYGRDKRAWASALRKLPAAVAALVSQAILESPSDRPTPACVFYENLAQGFGGEIPADLVRAPSGRTQKLESVSGVSPLNLVSRLSGDDTGADNDSQKSNSAGDFKIVVPKTHDGKLVVDDNQRSPAILNAVELSKTELVTRLSRIKRKQLSQRISILMFFILGLVLLTIAGNFSLDIIRRNRQNKLQQQIAIDSSRFGWSQVPQTVPPDDTRSQVSTGDKNRVSGDKPEEKQPQLVGEKEGLLSDSKAKDTRVSSGEKTQVLQPQITSGLKETGNTSSNSEGQSQNANRAKLAQATAALGVKKCPQGMVVIDGGMAELGSRANDPLRGFGENNLRLERLNDFCIDIYEYPNQSGRAPQVNVSWQRAKRICEKQNKRLCTEIEWERACKGPSGSRFPYGNNFEPAVCNVNPDAGGAILPRLLGEFSRCRSAYGVFDLAGNVAEWTASFWGNGVADKVIKGGAADQAIYLSRCAARANGVEGAPNVGFRCCASIN